MLFRSRWWGIDPLQARYPNLSPYAFVENSPIILIDPDGRWGVSVHYSITYGQMQKVGFSDISFIRKTAYMSSTYADMPPVAIARASYHLNYGWYGVHYGQGPTANSQSEAESYRHAMRSDAEAADGVTKQQAINRGLDFAWNNILNAAANGTAEDLGVGLHALQAVFAHQGMSTNEHLGVNISSVKALMKDLGFLGSHDLNKANAATNNALILFGLLTNDQGVINKARNESGQVNIDLRGITTPESQSKIQEAIKGIENVSIQF